MNEHIFDPTAFPQTSNGHSSPLKKTSASRPSFGEHVRIITLHDKG